MPHHKPAANLSFRAQAGACLTISPLRALSLRRTHASFRRAGRHGAGAIRPIIPSMSADARTREDVRMHGFSQRAEVGAVLQWIDQHARRLAPTRVSLDRASG